MRPPGSALLEAPDRLALSPNGHGGMLAAFAAERRDGRRPAAAASASCSTSRSTIPLVDIAGAEYIGYHILADAEMTSQVIAKRDPLEKVGNVVERRRPA